ncbi:uncharacterized protein LOC116841285 isoform X2 [Odontomachus brunneus]|uniref:uncharacterized protein LOC116841285 isoform X2 n=1 Tax=Odontomachus brunneus TaxID=486640 RepID=UPI0013F1B6A6|nr:uncharacterized protein LOC116841285 isoform X2 [Odontomachus brunneus]
MNLDKVSILVCLTPNIKPVQTDEQQSTKIQKLGMIISIRFLIASFLMYAIIPELRDLHGKMLMCYVICLIIAYVFLSLANYLCISPYDLCIGMGFNEIFSACATSINRFRRYRVRVFRRFHRALETEMAFHSSIGYPNAETSKITWLSVWRSHLEKIIGQAAFLSELHKHPQQQNDIFLCTGTRYLLGQRKGEAEKVTSRSEMP